ncbi:MAG: MBOAT family protein [Thiohalomonadales bacterium]
MNYFIGLKITRYNSNNDSKYAFYFLCLGILFNLLLLSYFKYSNFFITTINAAIDLDWGFYNVILPIGISFFTFQQIAYLVDTASNKTSEHNLLHYSLFVVFFPQLIAGPIVHHKQMLPQFSNDATYKPALDNISIGISIFVIGLFKKVIIADNLALIATPVFDAADAGNTVNFFQASSAVLAYSLQLYFDFSGYSDMAIGLARLFGVKLPLNFFSPYKAKNIIDFWKRWHMTLSVFLRDYLYLPLGGNRKGPSRRYVNLMLTMTIGGLWHGAAWTFVAWGALHGIYIIINHLWKKIWARSLEKWWSILLSQLVTFVFVSLAWVLFRAETFSGAMEIYSGLLNLPYGVIEKAGDIAQFLQYIGFSFSRYDIPFQEIVYLGFLFVILVLLLILPNTQQLMSNFQPAYDFEEKNIMFSGKSSGNISRLIFWKPTVIFSIFISGLFVLSFLSLSHVSEFLYFQF